MLTPAEGVEIHVGDVRTILPELEDGSVDCVATSPPYWALRDYGTGVWDGGDPGCDHLAPMPGGTAASSLAEYDNRLTDAHVAAKIEKVRRQFRDVCEKCGALRVDRQIGLEASPDEYVASLVAVFGEVRRVLKPEGTLWLNLGDTYVTAGTVKSSGNGSEGRERGMHGAFKVTPSSLGDRSNGGVPNQRPPGVKLKGLVGIPWRVALALQADGWILRSDIIWSKPNAMPESCTDRPTKAHEYIFLLAKQPRYWTDMDAIAEPAAWERWGDQTVPKYEGSATASGWMQPKSKDELVNGNGRQTKNSRSVWTIPSGSFPGAHFATWPEKLAERIIRAGCPEGGIVLDPFAGAGTTAVVAKRLGRRAVLVELNESYAELAAERCRNWWKSSAAPAPADPDDPQLTLIG